MPWAWVLECSASWVMACEYLGLGLPVANHSRPTPLVIISFLALLSLLLFFFDLVGWAAELGPGSCPDFLSFFPYGFFSGRFFF